MWRVCLPGDGMTGLLATDAAVGPGACAIPASGMAVLGAADAQAVQRSMAAPGTSRQFIGSGHGSVSGGLSL